MDMNGNMHVKKTLQVVRRKFIILTKNIFSVRVGRYPASHWLGAAY